MRRDPGNPLLTGTGRRLLLGFGLVTLLFGVASYVALGSLERMRGLLQEMRAEDDRMRIVLQLASAVRDQYAHQAHMILLGDDSHLSMYESSRDRVLELTRALQAADLTEPEAVDAVREISESSDEIDRMFRGDILPAVREGDREQAEDAHDRALGLVLRVQFVADQLAERFQASVAAFETRAGSVQRTTYLLTLFLLVGAVLFAAAIGAWIARSVAGPVARLEAGAARLASGDLDTRIEATGPPEFGRLARQFNAMTAALKAHQAELVRSERLAGVGRLAAGVAHEINNPLGVILGYTRLMKKRAPDGICEDLEVVEEETLRCTRIVEDLLDLARPWEIGEERVDLRASAEDASERLAMSGRAEQVDVQVAGEGAVKGSERALRQVLHNLVANAADAAAPDGRVLLTVAQGGGRVRVRVEDSGPGVAEEDRERVFEPFFTTKATGTGLGLAVSQAIAEVHGGRLSVDRSEALGGARFVLDLPAPGARQDGSGRPAGAPTAADAAAEAAPEGET